MRFLSRIARWLSPQDAAEAAYVASFNTMVAESDWFRETPRKPAPKPEPLIRLASGAIVNKAFLRSLERRAGR